MERTSLSLQSRVKSAPNSHNDINTTGSIRYRGESLSVYVSARWMAISLGLFFGLCAVDIAQGPQGRPRYVLQALDLDRDGKLSAQEIQAAPASLRSLDRNGDGQLTPDELEPARTDAGAGPVLPRR